MFARPVCRQVIIIKFYPIELIMAANIQADVLQQAVSQLRSECGRLRAKVELIAYPAIRTSIPHLLCGLLVGSLPRHSRQELESALSSMPSLHLPSFTVSKVTLPYACIDVRRSTRLASCCGRPLRSPLRRLSLTSRTPSHRYYSAGLQLSFPLSFLPSTPTAMIATSSPLLMLTCRCLPRRLPSKPRASPR